MLRLSVVIPVYNEEKVLPHLFRELHAFFDSFDDLECEAVLVDDGSIDRSWELMEQQHARDSRFQMLRLSRNFGHQIALTAGLDAAVGDAAIAMDADLQDPLEVAREMVKEWRAGSEIVYGQRARREGESILKKATAFCFYRMMKAIARDPTPKDVGDFYLLSRKALEALRAIREPGRYLRGIVFWLGYRPKCVRYLRQPRAAGVTKFNYRRMFRFALDGVLSSSSYPLTLASYMGLAFAFLGGVLAVRNLFVWLSDPGVVPGWTHTVVVILILGGVQLATIGILGLYLGRIHDRVRERPLYLVQEATSGLEDAVVGLLTPTG